MELESRKKMETNAGPLDRQNTSVAVLSTDTLRGYLRLRSVRYMIAGFLTIFILLFSSLDSIANANLTIHMFQHIGLFIGGIVFGYGLEKFLIARLLALKRRSYAIWRIFTGIMRVNSRTKGFIFVVVIPISVFAYWHVPSFFDAAVTNPTVHILEHLSYIITGSLVGLSISAVTRKWRIVLAYLGFMHAGMMGSIWVVWPSFFPIYSAAQNTQMATSLMLFGAVGVVLLSSQLLRTLDII